MKKGKGEGMKVRQTIEVSELNQLRRRDKHKLGVLFSHGKKGFYIK